MALALAAALAAIGCEEGAPASCRQTGVCDKGEICDLSSGQCVPSEETGVEVTDVAVDLAAAAGVGGVVYVAARAVAPAGLAFATLAPDSDELRLELVVAGEGVGRGLDVVVGADGHPRVSFRSGGAVKLARYNGTNWSVETLEETAVPSQGLGAWRTSVAIDDAGAEVVAYRDPAAGALRVAVRQGRSWSLRTADSPESDGGLGRGFDVSLAIAGGRPVVVHRDADDGGLRIVTPAETDWSSFEVGVNERRGAAWGWYASAAAASAGNVAVAFQDASSGALKVAISDRGELSVETVDDGAQGEVAKPAHIVGAFASLAYGERRRPLVAYQDGGAGALMLAERDPDGRWDRQLLDDAPVAGHGIALVRPPEGTAVVIHRRLTLGAGAQRSATLHVVRP